MVGGRLGAVAAMRARYWYTGVDVVPLAEVDCTVDLKLQQQCRQRGCRWCGKLSKLWWERLRRDGLGWGAVQCSAAHRQAALCLAFVAAPRLHFTSTSTTRQYQPTTTPSPASPRPDSFFASSLTSIAVLSTPFPQPSPALIPTSLPSSLSHPTLVACLDHMCSE